MQNCTSTRTVMVFVSTNSEQIKTEKPYKLTEQIIGITIKLGRKKSYSD